MTIAAGNEAGLLLQVITVALGLGAVVAASAMLLSVIMMLGAVYLVYLGVQAWWHRRALATAATTTTDEHRAPRRGRVFRDGFVVGATNPKGLLIFTAVLPQFVGPSRGDAAMQLLVLQPRSWPAAHS